MRVAGIDIGSNSVRLLVAEVTGGKVVEILRRRVNTRLGRGINGKRLGREAMERTLAALKAFDAEIRRHGPQAVVAVATSAVRDAQNGPAFVRAVAAEVGLTVRVLDGADEALLAWRGVQAGLNMVPTLVMDLGGGSTEFTWEEGGRLQTASTPVGAVRLTEAGGGARAAAAVLEPVLARIRQAGPHVCAGVGGTVTTACAMKLALAGCGTGRVHGRQLTRSDVDALAAALDGSRGGEPVPGLPAERADIMPAGLAIMGEVLAGLFLDSLVVSDTGLLHGLVLTGSGPVNFCP